MKITKLDIIKSMYGRPESESEIYEGEAISGWHLETGDGVTLKLSDIPDNEIENIYYTAAIPPEKHVYLKIDGKWKLVESIDKKGKSAVITGKEVSRADAICLDVAANLKQLCMLLPLLSEISISSSVKGEFKEAVQLFGERLSELPDDVRKGVL